jgi:hypothetical protein
VVIILSKNKELQVVQESLLVQELQPVLQSAQVDAESAYVPFGHVA